MVSGDVGIDMFAGPSDLMIVADGDADPATVTADLLAQAEHGPGTVIVLVSAAGALLDAVAPALEGFDGEAVAALVGTDDPLGVIEAFAPEHLQLVGAESEALAPRVRAAGCVLIGPTSGTAFSDYVAGSNHTLPTGGRRALRLRAQRRALPPPRQRGPHRRRGWRVGASRGAGGRRGGIRSPRAIDAQPTESDLMSRTATITRETKETSVELSLGLDGTGAGERDTGVGFLDHMLDLLARHGKLDLDDEGSRRPRDRGAPHRRGHRHRVGTGAGPGAGRPRRHHPLRARGRADGRGAGERARVDISGRPFCAFEAELPPGGTGGFDHELAEEFFRAVSTSAKLTLHLDRRRRHQRAPHDRGGLQGLRARTAPGGRDRPRRDRRAVHQGNAHVVTTIGVVDYGMGNRRSVEKALERAGANVVVSAPITMRCARLTGWFFPASARFPRRCGACARRAWTRCSWSTAAR